MFRAALGIALALGLFQAQAGWSINPALLRAAGSVLGGVKADIAAAHPEAKLDVFLVPQTGTAPGAHGLHP